jgi:hypothetical protein
VRSVVVHGQALTYLGGVWLRRLVASMVVVVAAVGCGDSSGGRSERSASTQARAAEAFTIRPVLANTAPPCDTTTPEIIPDVNGGKVVGCFRVGDAAVSGHDVESAEITSEDPVRVAIRLTPGGGRRLGALLAAHVGEQVAMVSHDVLLGAPTAQVTEVTRDVEVGEMSLDAARRLVRELGGDAAPPAETEPDELGDRASGVCERHRPPEVGSDPVLFTSPRTAGEITSLAARFLGHPIPPWDALPAEHFVASCSYGDPTDVNAPTTICTNGEVVVLSTPRQYFIDDEGRSTPDELSEAGGLRPPAPCR